jgi:tetratricopeptide (TPR) repeat protein
MIATYQGIDSGMEVLDDDAAASWLDIWLQAVRPGDDRLAQDADAAGRLAGACSGLPLALRISAALLQADPKLSAKELADELGAAQQRLRDMRDNGVGVFSVVAVFDLAYQKMLEPVAHVFRLLAVHPGPDASAATVEVLVDRPAREVHHALTSLAQVHLAEAVPGGTVRWRMHELVRLYARYLSDAQAQADRRKQALDRLLDYYVGMARKADGHVRRRADQANPAVFTSHDDALSWLDAERPCLIAAVGMAAGMEQDYAAASLSLYLAQYLAKRRLFDDLLAVTTFGLNAARRLGDRDMQGSALTNLGFAQRNLGRLGEAIAAHEDAVAIFREVGDSDAAGDALNNLGLSLREEGRLEQAIAAHQDAVATYREAGNLSGEAGALNNFGLVLKRVRRLEEAVVSHERAAAIYRKAGDHHGEGMAMVNLGDVLRELGRSAEAIGMWRKASCIFRETGDQHADGVALSGLGRALGATGQFKEAAAAFREAASVFRATGDQEREAIALANLETESG